MVRALTQAKRPRDKTRFPDAPRELTEGEIETLYGDLIRATVPKLAHPDHPLAMVETANAILKRRRTMAAKEARVYMSEQTETG